MKLIKNIIITFIILGVIILIFTIAPDYIRDDIKNKTNLIINNSNVTTSLKNNLYIDENGVIYISKADIANFFDSSIYYEEEYKKIITTSKTKVAALEVDNKTIDINGSNVSILGALKKIDDIFYLPFSELADVYNVELTYLKEQDTILVDSLDRELIKADCAKKMNVKLKSKILSRTVDKVEKGEKIILITTYENGWAKIRTSRGKIGYVKQKDLANQYVVREDLKELKKEEKVSLVWDYYSEYASAPDRTGEKIQGINVVSPAFFALERLGKGNIIDKVGTSGKKYIEWAHDNGYEVWAMFSNESMIQTTGEIIKDYKLRKKTIENIVNLAVKYKIEGINLDFENMYMEDKELFSRFVIELYPRLKECGIVLSIDVTAPDGGDTWSKCFNRHVLAKNCDYLIYMAYDQYGPSDGKSGTNSGYDWIEKNLNKFIGTQEEVASEKLILALPFYTRVWTESNGDIEPEVVSMKNINNVLAKTFSGIEKQWKDDVKQNYVEKTVGNKTYKMWIEDEESMRQKLSLVEKYNLAGVAFWEKDREDESIWKVIDEEIFQK